MSAFAPVLRDLRAAVLGGGGSAFLAAGATNFAVVGVGTAVAERSPGAIPAVVADPVKVVTLAGVGIGRDARARKPEPLSTDPR